MYAECVDEVCQGLGLTIVKLAVDYNLCAFPPSNHHSVVFRVLRCLRLDAWTLFRVNRQEPHHHGHYFYNPNYKKMFIPMFGNYGTHCTPEHPWKEGSPTLHSFSRFRPCSLFPAKWGARVRGECHRCMAREAV